MIQVLTYNAPHRKTYDLLCALKANGLTDVEVIASPWKEKRPLSPIVFHRPPVRFAIFPEKLSKNFGYAFKVIVNYDELIRHNEFRKVDVILIAGAGILPASIVNAYSVINVHPGYLPYVRGLDSLKWAIHQGLPIGVTSHLAAEEADAGTLIRREKVPVYASDTFHSLAYRVYEKEIELLAEGVSDLQALKVVEQLRTDLSAVRKRMSNDQEVEMLDRFQEMIRRLRLNDERT